MRVSLQGLANHRGHGDLAALTGSCRSLSFRLLGDDPQCSLWDVGRGEEPATGPGALPSSVAASVTFIGRWDLSFEILTDFPPLYVLFPLHQSPLPLGATLYLSALSFWAGMY